MTFAHTRERKEEGGDANKKRSMSLKDQHFIVSGLVVVVVVALRLLSRRGLCNFFITLFNGGQHLSSGLLVP